MGKKSFAGGLDSLLQLSTEDGEEEKATQTISKVSDKTPKNMSQKGLLEGEIRTTFIVKEETLEKFKAIAYWERKQIKFIAQEALEDYILKNKDNLTKAEKAYKARPHQ